MEGRLRCPVALVLHATGRVYVGSAYELDIYGLTSGQHSYSTVTGGPVAHLLARRRRL